MRCRVVPFVVFGLCGCLLAQDRHQASSPDQFVIGRHTFIDVGPPNDFYELVLVRPTSNGSSIERITLTPATDECFQPAKVEVAAGSLAESVAALLGKTNPCSIPEKELRRERKRCKKCLVFSGANIAMQVQCGAHTRIVRADILDKDMFDPAPSTPEHTTWTMQLLSRLDSAIGPGVWDRPMFPISEEQKDSAPQDSEALRDISSGKYDLLFQGAPDKPSDLYRAAQIQPPVPTIRLVSSTPFKPEAFVPPGYPPLARITHVEGAVKFTVYVDADGSVANFKVESGHPMLRGATENIANGWRFPKAAVQQKIDAVIDFATNCPAKKQ